MVVVQGACLVAKCSLVVLPSAGCCWDSCNGLPFPCSAISLIVALMLPIASETSLSKTFMILPLFLSPYCWLIKQPCMDSRPDYYRPRILNNPCIRVSHRVFEREELVGS